MKIKYPIIVEGKYDKIKLDSLVEATVITTGGFEIFNSREKELLLKRLCQLDKIILLTDSDGGGNVIRVTSGKLQLKIETMEMVVRIVQIVRFCKGIMI